MELDIDYGASCSKVTNITIDDVEEPKLQNLYQCPIQTSTLALGLNSCRINRKRRYSSTDNGPSEKIFVKYSESTSNFSELLNLSDEVLLEILKNCSSLTLDALSKTCRRFNNLVYDRKLWRDFDFSLIPLPAEEILHRFKYINKNTKQIKIRGLVNKYPLDKWKNNTITDKMLAKLIKLSPQLECLGIYEGYLNFNKISITDFPSTLKKLILSACEVNFPAPQKVFFNKIDSHMKNLQELSLEKCRWFETHDLIIFSKLPQLKKLNLRGCSSLKECVPYGSIATRFGFRTLEILDVRDTPISDSDIQCFNVTTTLRELLMECPEHLRNLNTSRYNATSSSSDAPVLDPPPLPPPPPQVLNLMAAHQDQQGMPNIENHIIHIVVQDRDYMPVNINNERVRNADNNGRDEEIDVQINDVQEAPPPQQQLIIVRGLGNNREVGQNNPGVRRNRISWEIVNGNMPIRPSGHFYDRFFRLQRSNQLTFDSPPITLVSDRGLRSFGLPRDNVQDDMVWIRAEIRPPDTFIEKMVVRHYKLVTDISLRHLACCSPKLKMLDVTGTSVTIDGVRWFKLQKPQCTVISDFNIHL